MFPAVVIFSINWSFFSNMTVFQLSTGVSFQSDNGALSTLPQFAYLLVKIYTESPKKTSEYLESFCSTRVVSLIVSVLRRDRLLPEKFVVAPMTRSCPSGDMVSWVCISYAVFCFKKKTSASVDDASL